MPLYTAFTAYTATSTVFAVFSIPKPFISTVQQLNIANTAIHQKCLQWANRFGQKFPPQKYELIHFTRRRNTVNLAASIQLDGVVLEPKKDIRVLGVWLDTKLKWTGHLRELRRKAASQTQAITRITAPTWGASFLKARQICTAVVRPTIAHAAPIWHVTPYEKNQKPSS